MESLLEVVPFRFHCHAHFALPFRLLCANHPTWPTITSPPPGSANAIVNSNSPSRLPLSNVDLSLTQIAITNIPTSTDPPLLRQQATLRRHVAPGNPLIYTLLCRLRAPASLHPIHTYNQGHTACDISRRRLWSLWLLSGGQMQWPPRGIQHWSVASAPQKPHDIVPQMNLYYILRDMLRCSSQKLMNASKSNPLNLYRWNFFHRREPGLFSPFFDSTFALFHTYCPPYRCIADLDMLWPCCRCASSLARSFSSLPLGPPDSELPNASGLSPCLLG